MKLLKKKKVNQKKLKMKLYKYACWLNLLYDINNSLDNADDKVKQKYISLLNKINNKYNFLDYRCKTIIMLITNGNKNDYDNLKKTLGDEINDNIMAKKVKKIKIKKLKVPKNYKTKYINIIIKIRNILN